MVYPMPLAGGTSPVTLGGTILLHNVEFLSGLVLFQVVNPGTPIIYGTGASQLDMHTGRYGGSADGYALQLALCDLARFYNLPVNLGGLSSASERLDAQYGHEATSAGLLAYLAGADEMYSMGLLGSAQILSLEKISETYTPEDIEQISDGLVNFVGVAKKLSAPEAMNLLDKMAEVPAKVDLSQAKEVGPFGMIFALGNPEVKQGMGVMLELTKGLALLKNGTPAPEGEK